MTARDAVPVDRQHEGLRRARLGVVPDLSGREADALPPGESLELVADVYDKQVGTSEQAQGCVVSVHIRTPYPTS